MTDTALRLAAQKLLDAVDNGPVFSYVPPSVERINDAADALRTTLAAPQGTTREWIVYTETVADDDYTAGIEHYHVGVRDRGRIFEIEDEAEAGMIVAALNDFEQRHGPLPSGTTEPEDGGARKRWANATARRIALWMDEHAIARAQAWLEANGAPAASEDRVQQAEPNKPKQED